jgi:hypothetical protein
VESRYATNLTLIVSESVGAFALRAEASIAAHVPVV